MSVDLPTAVVRLLNATTAVTTLVGSNANYAHWIWQWKPQEQVEASGQVGVIVSQRGAFSAPNIHNDMEFPRLQVQVMADCDRDPVSFTIKERNAESKAEAVYRALNAVLHVPGQTEMLWPGPSDPNALRVCRSWRLGEPETSDVPDSDGTVKLLVFYGVTLG